MNEPLQQLRHLGLDSTTNRQVYLLSLNGLEELPDSFVQLSPRFVMLLMGDFSQRPQDLGSIAKRLVDAGCSYLCTWGPGCELMHDEMDEARLKAPQLVDDHDSVLMTTDHADDSIEDTVEFAVLRTTPAGIYEHGCNSTVLAVVGRDDWLKDVEAAARVCLDSHAI